MPVTTALADAAADCSEKTAGTAESTGRASPLVTNVAVDAEDSDTAHQTGTAAHNHKNRNAADKTKADDDLTNPAAAEASKTTRPSGFW